MQSVTRVPFPIYTEASPSGSAARPDPVSEQVPAAKTESPRPAATVDESVAVLKRLRQALNIRFQAGSVPNGATKYGDDDSPGKVASDLVRATRSDDVDEDAVQRVRLRARAVVESVAKSVSTVSGREAIGDAGREIEQKLDGLAEESAARQDSRFEVQARSKQRSVIKIRTQEGDIVRFKLKVDDRLSASSETSVRGGEISSSTEIARSSNSRLVLSVKGDLNDAELAAVRQVFQTADRLAAEFFSGDMQAALEIASRLEFDSAEIANVSMRFRSVERMKATQQVSQVVPVSIAPPATSPAEGDAGVVRLTGGSTPPADRVLPQSPATPTDRVAQAPEATAGSVQPGTAEPTRAAPEPAIEQPRDRTATFLDFLGKLADYLEETADQLDDFAGRFSANAVVRYEFKQSFQLEILRVTMRDALETVGEAKDADSQRSEDRDDDD